MKKRDIFLMLIAAMLISFIFDNDIILFVHSIRAGLLNDIFDWVTNISSTIIILVVMTTMLLWETKKREWILPLWASFIVSGLLTLMLKVTVMRIRPFEALNLGIDLVFPGWNTSFPSWHAAAAFSGVARLDEEFPRFKWLWILFPSL